MHHATCIHKTILGLVISRAGALLDVLCVALGLEHLLGLLLLDVAALLPGDRGALPGGRGVALLLVHELGDGGGHAAAHLLGDVVANLAGGGHVIAYLEESELREKTVCK